MKYAIWRACELARIKFPEFEHDSWDELDVMQQSDLLAYSQIRQVERARAGGLVRESE